MDHTRAIRSRRRANHYLGARAAWVSFASLVERR